jgi:hypothetical protein
VTRVASRRPWRGRARFPARQTGLAVLDVREYGGYAAGGTVGLSGAPLDLGHDEALLPVQMSEKLAGQ